MRVHVGRLVSSRAVVGIAGFHGEDRIGIEARRLDCGLPCARYRLVQITGLGLLRLILFGWHTDDLCQILDALVERRDLGIRPPAQVARVLVEVADVLIRNLGLGFLIHAALAGLHATQDGIGILAQAFIGIADATHDEQIGEWVLLVEVYPKLLVFFWRELRLLLSVLAVVVPHRLDLGIGHIAALETLTEQEGRRVAWELRR